MNLDRTDKSLTPICPYCKRPVLYGHSREAVMVKVVANGFCTETGPYHGDCGRVVAQRALEAKS